jgi:hypothetical protein
VEARFQDGTRVQLTPKDGYLLWAVPASHWQLGHRIVSLVEYDRAGRVLVRDHVQAPAGQRDVYPCAKPRSYGYGVTMCP